MQRLALGRAVQAGAALHSMRVGTLGLRVAQRTISSSAGLRAAEAAKPRATAGVSTGKRMRHYYMAALLGGPLVFVGYLAYKYKSVQEALDALRSLFEGVKDAGVADPSIEELQRALGPSPPDGYINVIIAMENLLIRREWDRRYGWRYEVRPGVKELFTSLLESGAMVTLWSDASGTVAAETAGKLSMDFGFALPITPLHLGPEHCFANQTDPKKKEKHIEYFNRDPKSVLLVDVDALSETVNPGNAVLVRPMSEFEAERAVAEKEGRPATAIAADTTTTAIAQLVARVRADAQGSGEVNVPHTLAVLRSEAAAEGFAPDTAGIVAHLQAEARRVGEADRRRKEQGLGGLMRRTIEGSRALAGKPAIMELAASKGYRDPGVELGEESILTQKVREASRKMQMDRPMGSQ